MADENVVVGEVVTGRRIETDVVVHFVHGLDPTTGPFPPLLDIRDITGRGSDLRK